MSQSICWCIAAQCIRYSRIFPSDIFNETAKQKYYFVEICQHWFDPPPIFVEILQENNIKPGVNTLYIRFDHIIWSPHFIQRMHMTPYQLFIIMYNFHNKIRVLNHWHYDVTFTNPAFAQTVRHSRRWWFLPKYMLQNRFLVLSQTKAPKNVNIIYLL